MEALLPDDVWREPQPVLSIQGSVDWDPGVHDRLIQALHAVSLDLASVGGGPLAATTSVGGLGIGVNPNSVPFRFLSLDAAVVFPPKKPPSPLKAPDGRPLDGYAIKGLLKGSWLHKHVAQLPSAAVLLAPLDPRWPAPEWARREQQLLHDLERIRAQLGPRDVRVFTLLLRNNGGASGSTTAAQAQEEKELEERVAALRRRLPGQYDGRLLYVLSDPGDLQPASANLRRVYKHVRDASSGYYFLAAKRAKRLETALSRHTQAPLIARYRLKVAVWSEFLGGGEQALKHYRKAFDALLDMNAILHSASASSGGFATGPYTPGTGGGAPVPLGLGMSGSGALAAGAAGAAGAYQLSAAHSLGGWLAQVKAVAELVNFKLCYYAMREARHPEAVAQFRQLLQTWCWRVVRPPRITGGATTTTGTLGPPPTPSDSNSGNFPLSLATPRGAAGGAAADSGSSSSSGLSSGLSSPQRRLDFLHHEWASRQYQLFAALLQRFPAPPPPGQPLPPLTSVGMALPSLPWSEAENYVLPDHHLLNAALHLARERAVARFLGENPRADSKFAERVAQNLGLEGPLLVAPLYVGGRPRLVDPGLEEGRGEADVNELVQLIMERDEARKPLAEGVRRLLAAGVAAYDPSRPPRPRFKGLQHLQLADELLAAELPAEAWPHYCAALRRYSEEHGPGWHVLAAAALLRARRCALALGRPAHYLDLTLRLLAHGLRPALGAGDRRLLALEALHLLSGLPDFATAAAAAAEAPGWGQLAGLPNVFTAQFPPTAAAAGVAALGEVVYDEDGAGVSMMDEAAEVPGTAPLGVEPLLRLPAEPGAGGGVEAALECGANGGRQLLSFSVAFPRAAAAMGDACPLTLRVVSHWPVPLRASRLLLRFNKDYLGAVTVLDAGGPPTAAERWRASLAPLSAPPPPPGSSSAGSSSSANDDAANYQEVDEAGTARAPLLLRPDHPLDLRLAVPVPTHELVEVGDLLHALSLHVSLDPDPLPAPSAAGPLLPCGVRPFTAGAGPFTLTVPSGVACLDGGVKAANVCCRVDADAATTMGAGGQQQRSSPLVVAQPSSLPVPLHASLRGFPAVEVIRPLASATLGLAGLTTPTAEPPLQQPPQVLSVEEDEAMGGRPAVPSVPTLVGHMHCLWVRIESRADRLGQPKLYVRSDPPPPSPSAEDALFFCVAAGDGQGHAPLPLGKDGQPERLDVLELAGAVGGGGVKGEGGAGEAAGGIIPPESTLLVPVWVRLAQEGRVKVNMVLVYHSASIAPSAATGLSPPRRAPPPPPSSTPATAAAAAADDDDDPDAFSNLMVSSEFVFDLEAYPPFATAFDVASPCPVAAAGATPQDPLGPDGTQHTLFTNEEVVMRFGVKTLVPPGWEGDSGGPPRRPQIESVVWHPEEGAPIAATATHAGGNRGSNTSTTGNGGRVLYSRAAAEAQQQQQQQQQPLAPPSPSRGGKRRPRAAAAGGGQQQQQQQLEDVLSLAFHFRCPPKPSTHPLPLGHMRVYWTAPQEPPPAGANTTATTTAGWVSCTEVPCPPVSVVAPDLAVHLQAPLEARAGEPFRLRWTLENLLGDRALDLRVRVAEGGGGAAGVSSEEALVFGGVRESVVQVLPRRSLALSYRVAALVTGPVALPRLLLTPLAPPAGLGDGAEGGAPAPLRVSYRYVDNVMGAASSAAAAGAVPATPSAGGGDLQAAPSPADTRHLFVLPASQ